MVLWLLPLLEPLGLLLGTIAAKAGNEMLSRLMFSALERFAARGCWVLGIWAPAVVRGCGVPAVPEQVSTGRNEYVPLSCKICIFRHANFRCTSTNNRTDRTCLSPAACIRGSVGSGVMWLWHTFYQITALDCPQVRCTIEAASGYACPRHTGTGSSPRLRFYVSDLIYTHRSLAPECSCVRSHASQASLQESTR